MEKQEAVGFILRELQNGRSQPDIVAALSSKLNAPRDVVGKFVAQVASQYKPAPPPPPKAPAFDFEEAFQPATPPQAAASQPAAYFDFDADSEPDFAAQAAPGPTPPARPAAYPSPAPQAMPASPLANADSAPRTSSSRLPQVDEELEKFILSGLAKNRRQDDLVMSVCERTGMSWDQAQRAVALVGTKNRKKLVSRQNMIFIPLSIIFILGGLALILASVTDAMAYIDFWVNPQKYPLGPAGDIDRTVLYSFVLGIMGVLGGAAGLFTSLRNQAG
ncbi:MAG: hypothetical protein AB1894_11730 [Chloroflexota bacterium]